MGRGSQSKFNANVGIKNNNVERIQALSGNNKHLNTIKSYLLSNKYMKPWEKISTYEKIEDGLSVTIKSRSGLRTCEVKLPE